MLRVEITEEGQPPLPPIDLEPPFVIGSALDARVRLPASVASPEHIRIESAEAAGEYTVGTYRIRVVDAPAGVAPTPPQRTESLARELMRNLLGTSGAPTLEIVRGPAVGAKRPLAAPESTLVIGRGDEADWILADDDLSRAHAEVRRSWDGVFVRDLGSKNGTKVDGVEIDGEAALRDGAELALGKVVLRFRDPTARVAEKPVARAPQAEPVRERASALPFYAALAILVAALAGLVWIVSS